MHITTPVASVSVTYTVLKNRHMTSDRLFIPYFRLDQLNNFNQQYAIKWKILLKEYVRYLSKQLQLFRIKSHRKQECNKAKIV